MIRNAPDQLQPSNCDSLRPDVLLEHAVKYLREFSRTKTEDMAHVRQLRRLFTLFGIVGLQHKDYRAAAQAADGMADGELQNPANLFESACCLPAALEWFTRTAN